MIDNYESKINPIKIGERIKTLRKKAHFTQERLSEMVGISQKHLSRIEQGYHYPHFDIIISLAKALDVPLDAFVEDFDHDNINVFFQLHNDDIREMSRQQLNMLKDAIEMIKKYNF